MKDVLTFNSSIPQFAIPQFFNHIALLCLCDLVAELLQNYSVAHLKSSCLNRAHFDDFVKSHFKGLDTRSPIRSRTGFAGMRVSISI